MMAQFVQFEAKQNKIPVDKGKLAINCIKCKRTCTYPTTTSKSEDLEKSECMKNKEQAIKCKICKCPSETHRLEEIRYEKKRFYRSKSREDSFRLTQRRHVKANTDQEQKVKELTEKIKRSQLELFAQIQQAHKSKARLKEIALNPDPLTLEEYIDFLIQAEKMDAKVGFQSRIEHLECAKKASLLCREEVALRGEILPDIMSVLEDEEIEFESLGTEISEVIDQPSSIMGTLRALISYLFGKN